MKKPRKGKALSAAETQRLLGSEAPVAIGNLPIDPIGMSAIASIVRVRLISRGGRPSDPAWTISRKVPMRLDTWKELDRLARAFHEQNIRISAGQVAAIALEKGLPRDQDENQPVRWFASRQMVAASAAYEVPTEVRAEAVAISRAYVKCGFFGSCAS